ncbi:hypothetical protein DXG01_007068 [Tephrocybe rancida]|nr:hypothetical protein DXG01_007068 [Tephrocybe rancida]
MGDVQQLATLLEKIHQQATAQLLNIVSYCIKRNDNMNPWAWPINSNGIRLTPVELQGYQAHRFHLLCCLCPMQEAKGDVCRYTQSEVYVSRKWEFFRDYMMGCANPDKKCGYEISLEKPYSMPGLHTRHYVSCDSNAKKQDLQVTEVPVDTQEARQEKIAKLIERLEKQKDAKVLYILNFIMEFMDLRPWTWPIDADSIRLTPSELQGYRAHLFHLPSCLCAIQTTEGQIPRHTASKVYLSEKWEFLGEYMLGCASQDEKCGYEGEF